MKDRTQVEFTIEAPAEPGEMRELLKAVLVEKLLAVGTGEG